MLTETLLCVLSAFMTFGVSTPSRGLEHVRRYVVCCGGVWLMVVDSGKSYIVGFYTLFSNSFGSCCFSIIDSYKNNRLVNSCKLK